MKHFVSQSWLSRCSSTRAHIKQQRKVLLSLSSTLLCFYNSRTQLDSSSVSLLSCPWNSTPVQSFPFTPLLVHPSQHSPPPCSLQETFLALAQNIHFYFALDCSWHPQYYYHYWNSLQLADLPAVYVLLHPTSYPQLRDVTPFGGYKLLPQGWHLSASNNVWDTQVFLPCHKIFNDCTKSSNKQWYHCKFGMVYPTYFLR